MSAAALTGLIGSYAAAPIRRTAASALSLLILAGILALAPLRATALGVFAVSLAVATAIQPVSGLVLIAIAIPWGSTLGTLPLRGVAIVDLLVGVVLAGWLARSVVQREIRIRTTTLIWPLLVFVWMAGASLTRATSWQDGLPEWLKWVEFAVLYVVALQVMGRRSAQVVVAVLLLTGVSQAVLGAYQFLTQSGPEGFVLMGRFMRAYGTLNQPNPYAGYLGYLAPVAAATVVMSFRMWRSTGQIRGLLTFLFATGSLLALVAGIFMSWSRGAWLGLAASLLVVFGLTGKRSAAIALGVGAAFVLIVSVIGVSWLPDAVEGRVQDLGTYVGGLNPASTEITDDNFSVLERLAHWQAGRLMFENEPWLGVGIGNYGANYGKYALPHWYDPLGHAHNVFINFVAETGILGLGAFLSFWLALAWTLSRRLWRGCQAWEKALAVGLLGTWTYLTIHNLFDNLFVGHMQLQLALLLAAFFAVRRPSDTSMPWCQNESRSIVW